MLLYAGITVKSQDLSTQSVPSTVKSDADDFIDHFGYDEDYSTFYIRTGFSGDYGLCYDDPCDYYDEEEGLNYDYLTTIMYDPETGLNYDLYGGYHINRFISVGIGLEYFHGFNINQTRTGTSGESGSFNETVKWNATMFGIIPGIEISPGFSTLNPWIDIGAYIGVIPRIMEKETNTSSSGTSSSTTTQTGYYHGGVPIGFDIKAGVDYKLTKTLGLYADLNFRGLNFTPKKYSMKTYSIDGVDYFSTLSTKQKETDFVKSYDSRETIPPDSPNKALKESFPFTGIGLDIGVKLNLGKWERW